MFFTLDGVEGVAFRERLAAQGVLVMSATLQRVRLVCHLDVTREDIDTAIPIIRDVLQSLPTAS